jgi:hypothetical protein
VQFGIIEPPGLAASRLSLGPPPNGAVKESAESQQALTASLNAFASRIFVSILNLPRESDGFAGVCGSNAGVTTGY